MSTPSAPPNRSPISLASYLFARREAILNMWRASCEADRTLSHTASLSREEFNNEIPTMLNLFEQRLRREPEEQKLSETASAHGLHRWHKGYSLRELLSEINHFTQCLSTELSCYVQFYPMADSSEIAQAYAQIIQFSNELIDSSIIRYDDLQRKQAAGRADALQQTLDRISDLTQQRSKLLQMTSHDLRGGFGVINGAASLLDRPNSSDQERKNHLQMLQRTLLSVSHMLSQLTDLSRLEAGQESLSIELLNVSNILHSVVESAQPLADQRGLVLRADGPSELFVCTDRVKLQRIIQNLLLNALQNTPAGMVSVSWSGEDNYRWTLGVQDTGTGLPANLTASLTAPLKPTVDSSSVFSKEKSEDAPMGNIPAPAKMTKIPPVSGEGIGLYIVKRLSELLNASIDIETGPNKGTLFRIRLPAQYKVNNE